MQDRLTEILLFVLAAIIGLFLLVALLDWLLPNATPLGDWAGIVLALVTILAIIFGGLFAAVKFELFRDFEPHLTISHQVSQRPIGSKYVHIAVKATLYNTSKVRVEILDGIFRIYQVAPLGDLEVEKLYSDLFETGEVDELQWPTLDELYPSWAKNDLSIEPGESHHETIEFIVGNSLETVLIYTYFCNVNYPKRPESPMGWGETTVYDIAV